MIRGCCRITGLALADSRQNLFDKITPLAFIRKRGLFVVCLLSEVFHFAWVQHLPGFI